MGQVIHLEALVLHNHTEHCNLQDKLGLEDMKILGLGSHGVLDQGNQQEPYPCGMYREENLGPEENYVDIGNYHRGMEILAMADGETAWVILTFSPSSGREKDYDALGCVEGYADDTVYDSV